MLKFGVFSSELVTLLLEHILVMRFLLDSCILSMLNLLHGKMYSNSLSNRFTQNICPQKPLQSRGAELGNITFLALEFELY